MHRKNSLISRIRSFRYAGLGLLSMLRQQPNFFIQIVLAVIALGLGYFLKLSNQEWLWIVLCIGAVLSAEMFNTAIEKVTDIIQPEKDKRAGQVKDIAAGAVLVVSIMALVIGLIIFLPKIIAFI